MRLSARINAGISSGTNARFFHPTPCSPESAPFHTEHGLKSRAQARKRTRDLGGIARHGAHAGGDATIILLATGDRKTA